MRQQRSWADLEQLQIKAQLGDVEKRRIYTVYFQHEETKVRLEIS